MDIHLIRHGRAEPRGTRPLDTERALTAEGKDRLETIVSGLDHLGVDLDLVLTSPWRRAVETAAFLSRLGEPRIVETPHLAEDPGAALLGEIRGENVALVGHEPWMSEILAWLVTGEPEDAPGFTMKKGGAARLVGEPRPAGTRLVWLMPPAAFIGLMP